MEINVRFYLEPLKGKNYYEPKHILLADWFCHSKDEIISQVIGMTIGAQLKYKRFRIAAYNAKTGEIIHATVKN